jgi:hypothetical protein
MYGGVGVRMFTAAEKISSRTTLKTLFLLRLKVSYIKLLRLVRFLRKLVFFNFALNF